MSTTVNPVRIFIPERLRGKVTPRYVTVLDVYEPDVDNPQIVLTRLVESANARDGWPASNLDDETLEKYGLQPEWRMWWLSTSKLAEHYPHAVERWQVGDTLTIASPWTVDGTEILLPPLTTGDRVTYEEVHRDNLLWVRTSRGERYAMDASCLQRVPAEPATAESVTAEPATDESERIREQEAEIERLRQALAREKTRHQEDVGRIGEALIREAEYREWCSEYDEVVGEINSTLHVPLPTRSTSAVIQFTVTVQVDNATGELRQRIIDEDESWLSGTFSFDVGDDGDAAGSDYFIDSTSVESVHAV